ARHLAGAAGRAPRGGTGWLSRRLGVAEGASGRGLRGVWAWPRRRLNVAGGRLGVAEAERSPERLSVLVVDDHDVVHWGFRLMLPRQPWVQRCLSAHSAREALSLVGR